jgi:hypothetical protein
MVTSFMAPESAWRSNACAAIDAGEFREISRM